MLSEFQWGGFLFWYTINQILEENCCKQLSNEQLFNNSTNLEWLCFIYWLLLIRDIYENKDVFVFIAESCYLFLSNLIYKYCFLNASLFNLFVFFLLFFLSATEKLSDRKLNVAEVTQSEIGQKQKLQTVLEAVNNTLRPHGWTVEWSVDCEFYLFSL